jgi:hypothetical protein
MHSVTKTIESQIATLTAYRKSLIHECVTGERRITEADAGKVPKGGVQSVHTLGYKNDRRESARKNPS